MAGRAGSAAAPALLRGSKDSSVGRAARAGEPGSGRPVSAAPSGAAEQADVALSTLAGGVAWGGGGGGRRPAPGNNACHFPCHLWFQTPVDEGERWRNMEKAGREHSAAGNAPGRSRTRAWEKAASARVAVNGCGMEPDPGNLAPRFPSSVSRTLTLAGALREL